MGNPIRVSETARGPIWSQRVRLEDADGSFDFAFWQAQTAEARFAAAWEMVETMWEMKNRPANELRLQRTLENFQPLPG